MAGSVNKVILVGNLGKDPVIRRTQDGKPVASFSIATSESWKDKTTGEKREKTEWHNIAVFNENICRFVEQYLKKGAKVYIEGQLQTRKWQDKETGQDRYTTEVVLQNFNGVLTSLDSAPSGGGARSSGGFAAKGGRGDFPDSGGDPGYGGRDMGADDFADMDDKVPF